MNTTDKAARTSVLIALTALNLSIASLVSWLKLPVYLDSIGIVLCTLLLGWPSGLICAATTCGLGFFLVSPYLLAYIGTSCVIVATVEMLRKVGGYGSIKSCFFSAITLAVVCAIASAPVTAFLFGGVTASGADFLTAILLKTGHNILDSVLLSGVSSEIVDKTIVTFTAYAVVKSLPVSFLTRFGFRGLAP